MIRSTVFIIAALFTAASHAPAQAQSLTAPVATLADAATPVADPDAVASLPQPAVDAAMNASAPQRTAQPLASKRHASRASKAHKAHKLSRLARQPASHKVVSAPAVLPVYALAETATTAGRCVNLLCPKFPLMGVGF